MMVAILNVFPAEWELAFRRRWEVAFPGADPYLVHLASLRGRLWDGNALRPLRELRVGFVNNAKVTGKGRF